LKTNGNQVRSSVFAPILPSIRIWQERPLEFEAVADPDLTLEFQALSGSCSEPDADAIRVIVFTQPVIGDDLPVAGCREPLGTEYLPAQCAVERLVRSVLPWSGCSFGQADFVFGFRYASFDVFAKGTRPGGTGRSWPDGDMFEKLLHDALMKGVATGALQVVYPSGRREVYGPQGGREVAVRIQDAAALRGIALDPGLAVGEMYMEGRLAVERGDVRDLLDLCFSSFRADTLTAAGRLGDLGRGALGRLARGAGHAGIARRNVAHHYDLDERLYRLFLDEDMQYSCAWFERPDMSLEAAQLAKKRLIAAKLMVRPGARVLDIGCGWGGMALYLARICGAEVTGITLSGEQLRVAKRRAEEAGLADRVTFRLQDYRDVTERFDAAVSVGMLEHVGLGRMRDYMAMVARVLKPDGVMLLHSIANARPATYTSPFIAKHIFPGGRIPALSQIVGPAEAAGLLFREIEILPLHYAETLREWRRRFMAARERVLELYDERFLRMWEFYLAGSEMSFRHRNLHVVHLEIVKDFESLPIVRGFVETEMSRLRRIEASVPDYARFHEVPSRRRHQTAAE